MGNSDAEISHSTAILIPCYNEGMTKAYRTSQIATDTILAFEPFSWPVVLQSLGMFVADLFKRPNRATPNSGYV